MDWCTRNKLNLEVGGNLFWINKLSFCLPSTKTLPPSLIDKYIDVTNIQCLCNNQAFKTYFFFSHFNPCFVSSWYVSISISIAGKYFITSHISDIWHNHWKSLLTGAETRHTWAPVYVCVDDCDWYGPPYASISLVKINH